MATVKQLEEVEKELERAITNMTYAPIAISPNRYDSICDPIYSALEKIKYLKLRETVK